MAAVPAWAVGNSSGQLYAFGDNVSGQLGSATNNGTDDPNPTPAVVSLPGATGPVVQVAAGHQHSLAVTSTGQLYAWGINDFGQLGSATNNGTGNPNPTPALVSLAGATGPVVQVAAGQEHSLAVTSTGQLYAFGWNRFGQLGSATNNGTDNPNPTPALVSLPGATGRAVQVAAGDAHSLAVTSTGQLYAFGENGSGQLGSGTNIGTVNPNPAPALVSLPGATGPVVQVAAGHQHSLAVTSTGQLYAWGINDFGQLGSASNIGTSNPNPALVSLPGATGRAVQVAAGDVHSLAVTSTGQLYAFGDNRTGQLGSAPNSGTNNPNPTPALVSLAGATGPVVQVAGGELYSQAVTSTGQLYAFGLNNSGQLGSTTNNGTTYPNPTPALVALPGGVSVDTVARGPEAQASLVVLADLAVATVSLPGGTVGVSYSAQLQASGGLPRYRWSASGLPPGLLIDPSRGVISGTSNRAGAFSVQVTVNDGDGIAASKALALSIAPAPTPVLTALRVSPRTFSLAGRKVNGRCAKPTSANDRKPSCRRAIALKSSYTLNTTATVAIALTRVVDGRKVHDLCLRPTPQNRQHRACRRLLPLHRRIIQAGKPGANMFTFHGSIGRRDLAPGTYQLTATPSAGGHTGNAQMVTFTLVT
jgi:alpha-tubulin suppressor-like RCC1 family protein